jgi:hypothetical protein
MNAPDSFVPALPGYYALEFFEDDIGPVVNKRAVVAWRIVGGSASPVTMDCEKDYVDRPFAVLRPDGVVETPVDGVHDTEAGWMRGERRRARQDAEANFVLADNQ